MLKWKSVKLDTFVQGEEELKPVLAGMARKNRVIKSILADSETGCQLRVYRDADQIVDLDSTMLSISTTPAFRFTLPMDLTLAEGQLCNIGYYGLSAGATTPDIAIGYEEAD